jgi:hypothetical protein
MLAGVAACSDGPTTPVLELAAAEQRWHMAGVRSYQYDVSIQCFCLVRPIAVQVRDGAVVSVTYADRGGVADTTYYRSYLTIDRIFTLLQQTVASGPASVDFRFDPGLGYPMQVSVDVFRNAADDEWGFTLSQFTPLP